MNSISGGDDANGNLYGSTLLTVGMMKNANPAQIHYFESQVFILDSAFKAMVLISTNHHHLHFLIWLVTYFLAMYHVIIEMVRFNYPSASD